MCSALALNTFQKSKRQKWLERIAKFTAEFKKVGKRKKGLDKENKKTRVEFVWSSVYETPYLEVSSFDWRALTGLHKQPNNQAATLLLTANLLSASLSFSVLLPLFIPLESNTTFLSEVSLPLYQITVFMLHSSTVFAPPSFLPSSFFLFQVSFYFPALLPLALPPVLPCLSHTQCFFQ